MLESLLTPEAVAVIGASRTPGKVGHEVVANLKEGGFAGAIVPVNPSARRWRAAFRPAPKLLSLSLLVSKKSAPTARSLKENCFAYANRGMSG